MAAFSEAYLRAITASAGVAIAAMTPDINGVDAHLETQDDGQHPGFALNVQLKTSATRVARTADGGLRYPLEAKEHVRLCRRVVVPRILIVLELAQDSGDWAQVVDPGLLLRAPAWWLSLRGQVPTRNTSSVTVAIPSDARLTIDALLGNMRSMESG